MNIKLLFRQYSDLWELFCLFQRLADWVAVQSVSAWPEKRGEIKKMMEIAAKDIEKLGGTVELVDVGTQKVRVCWSTWLFGFFLFFFYSLLLLKLKFAYFSSVEHLFGCLTVWKQNLTHIAADSHYTCLPCSFPVERRYPCLLLFWGVWGQTQARRLCASMVTWMSSQPILRMDGIQSLSLWWRKMVRADIFLLFVWLSSVPNSSEAV